MLCSNVRNPLRIPPDYGNGGFSSEDDDDDIETSPAAKRPKIDDNAVPAAFRVTSDTTSSRSPTTGSDRETTPPPHSPTLALQKLLSPTTPAQRRTAASAEINPDPYLVTAELQLDGTIGINITTKRPHTVQGQAQGDHITAFRTFIELIYNAVNNKQLTEAIPTMQNIASAIFSKDTAADLTEICENFLRKHQENTTSYEDRKILTALLRILTKLEATDEESRMILDGAKKTIGQAESIERIKQDLKNSHDLPIAQFIASIASYIIKAINMGEDMVFFKKQEDAGVAANPAHSNDVKQAIYTLRLIHALLKFDAIIDPAEKDKAKTALLAELEDPGSIMKQGLNNIIAHLNPKMPRLKRELSAFDKRTEAAARASLTSDDMIFTLPKTELTKIVGEKIGKLFDFPYSPDRKIDELCKYLTRHIAIIANTFEGLQNLLREEAGLGLTNSGLYQALLITEIAEKQGWSKCIKSGDMHKLGTAVFRQIAKTLDFTNFSLYDDYRIKTQADIVDSRLSRQLLPQAAASAHIT